MLLRLIFVIGAVSAQYKLDITCPADKSAYADGNQRCCKNIVLANINGLCCKDTGANNKCLCKKSSAACLLNGQQPGSQTPQPTPSPSGNLCMPSAPTSRLLGGLVVPAVCDTLGTISLKIEGTHVCNAVLVDAGGFGKELHTLKSCYDTIKTNGIDNDYKVTVNIFNDSFPLTDCTKKGPEDVNAKMVRIGLPRLARYFIEKHMENCPTPGCIYKSQTMRRAIDFKKCFIISAGQFSQTGFGMALRKVAVETAVVGECADAPTGDVQSQCFIATGQGAHCNGGDDGAGVYCTLNTGENVLYGITAASASCDPDKRTFNVFPVMMPTAEITEGGNLPAAGAAQPDNGDNAQPANPANPANQANQGAGNTAAGAGIAVPPAEDP